MSDGRGQTSCSAGPGLVGGGGLGSVRHLSYHSAGVYFRMALEPDFRSGGRWLPSRSAPPLVSYECDPNNTPMPSLCQGRRERRVARAKVAARPLGVSRHDS